MTGLLSLLTTAYHFGCERPQASRQWREEKQLLGQYDKASYDRLIRRYPLGYVVLFRDHNEAIPPARSERVPDLRLDWATTNRPLTVKGDRIQFTLPDMESRRLHNVFRSVTVSIPRVVGHPIQIMGGDSIGAGIWLEVLIDNEDFTICAIGLTAVGDSPERESR